MSGIKGRSGRRKSLATQINEAMEVLNPELPSLVLKLVEKAKNGDIQALIYLIDRAMGKPKASLEVEGGQELEASLVVKLFQLLAGKQKELETRDIKQLQSGSE